MLSLLGAPQNRRWLALLLVVQGTILSHALHGWYPLNPLLRRLGLRTGQEIEAEHYTLKALRGDFAEAQP